MHTSQTAHSFTKLLSDFVCFDNRGEFVPPFNVSILPIFLFLFFILQKCYSLKSINEQWPFVLNVPWFHSLFWHHFSDFKPEGHNSLFFTDYLN